MAYRRGKKWSKKVFVKSGIYGVSMEVLRIKAARVTEQPYIYLNDHLTYHFGTARVDEILGKIGDDGRPFAAQLIDYFDNYSTTPAEIVTGNPIGGLLLALTYNVD